MSHGFIDDIPGHAEFWRWFRGSGWFMRFRLLCRLWNWKRSIFRLSRRYPELSLKDLEDRLINNECVDVIENLG